MSSPPAKSRLKPTLPLSLGFLLGTACDWVWPWPIGPFQYVLPVGLLLVVLVGISVVALSRAFKRHGTSSNPRDEATAILAAGLLQTTLGFLFNNVWVLLTVLPAMIVIHYVVVLKEEAYLEERFGDRYLEYKSRVRRWI